MSGEDEPALDASGTSIEFPSDVLERVAALLGPHIDVRLSNYKAGTIQRRIVRRMGAAGIALFDKYVERLEQDQRELEALASDLLIGVTAFFRNPEAWAALRECVLAPLVEQGDPVRAWVAGCASGEEAYTLAMALLDEADRQGRRVPIQVFATDVDADSLAVARNGTYALELCEGLTPEQLDRYFTAAGDDRVRVKPALRDVVSFAAHDLCSDPPFSRMDVVTCRNVLIYLQPEMQEQVLKVLHFALKPEGHLYLGTSEALGGCAPLFATVSKQWRIFRRVGNSHPISVHRAVGARYRFAAPEVPERHRAGRADPTADRARQALLDAKVPPSVVVAADGTILFAHGSLERWLRFPSGEPRLDLGAVLRSDLATRVRGALYQARRDGAAVTVLSTPVAEEGATRVTVTPLPQLGEGTAIVSFEALPQMEEETPPEVTGAPPADAERLIAQLETELEATREDLRITVEELESSHEQLRASHEEAISTNEELQSTNEELEATTEELRSLNEELTTTNARLKEQIEQAEQARDDLANFFASTKLATLFLDPERRIKRCTPAAEDLLGIGPTDIGRKVDDVARDLLQADLAGEVVAVLADLAPKIRELRLPDGRWFVRRILPYRTKSQRIDGVVITFLDVTSLRSTTERLEAREREQAVLARLGTRALTETDLDGFMDQVVREVQQTLGTDLCKIAELRPGRRDLLLRAGVGWREGVVGRATEPGGTDSPAGYTLLVNQPVVMPDLTTERRFGLPPLLREHGVVSGISCVIHVGGRPYGVLAALMRRPRAFTFEDTHFLEAVAHVLASAMQQVLAARRLAIERAVAQVLYEARTLAEAIPRVFEAFHRELDASIGECWMPAQGGDPDELVCTFFAVADEPNRERQLKRLLASEPARRGVGLVGAVYDSGIAAWVGPDDPEGSGRLERAAEAGFSSAVALPIVAGRDPVGVLCLFLRRDRTYDDQLLRSLEAIGREIGEFVRRVEAEDALRETEARNSAVLDLALDALVMIDAEGRIVEFNRAAERIFEYARSEVLGKRMVDLLVPPALRDRHNHGVRRHLETGRTTMLDRRVEMSAMRRDGTEFPAEIAITRVETNAGPVFAAFIRDTSERRRAEEALRVSEERYRRIFSTVGVAVFEEDFTEVKRAVDEVLASGVTDFREWLELHPEFVARAASLVRVTDVNEEAVRMLRAPSREALMSGLGSTFVADSYETFRRELEALAARRTLFTAESALQRLTGERIDVLIHVRFPVAHSGFDRVVVSVVDVTDRNRAERARQQSEWRFNQVVRTSPVPMLVFDDTGRILSASRSWGDILGRGGPAPVALEAWAQRAFGSEAETGLEVLRGLFDTESPVHGELDLVPPHGERRTVMYAGAPLGIAADGHRLRLFAATDITERKRTEQALREADRQKDQFIAMLGHELRNPLAAIRAAQKLLSLSPSPGDERLARTLAILDRQTAHMARLLDGLLDVSRIVSGRIALDRERVSLAGLVRETVEDRAAEIGRRKLVIEAPDGDPVLVAGDRVRIVQVIDNLLSNAIRFTDAQGEIRVSVRREEPYGTIEVSDTGIGMDADLLPHLFQPFRQAAQPIDRSGGGLGLGLSLVKRLAELHGGDVAARSDGPGKGSSFVVRLPLEQEVGEPTPLPELRRPPATRRVLVVEDHPDAAHLMGELLRSSGHEVALAHDGHQALALAGEFQPEVVICDIGLPGGMSGYALARELRRIPALEHSLLIALTGYGRPEDRAEAEAAGFDHHLTKPVDVELIERLMLEHVPR